MNFIFKHFLSWLANLFEFNHYHFTYNPYPEIEFDDEILHYIYLDGDFRGL